MKCAATSARAGTRHRPYNSLLWCNPSALLAGSYSSAGATDRSWAGARVAIREVGR